MRVLSTEKIPIKLWLDDIEAGALRQAKNLANLPFAFHHVAIMPDCHQGYGMPIGGILATRDVVVPNAVGVDIGCGMCALKTSLAGVERETLKAMLERIRQAVPVGFAHHKRNQDPALMPEAAWPEANGRLDDRKDAKDLYPVVFGEYESALRQLGTLGGGNHFIEIQKGSDGHVWIMIHSGSRNLGKRVAERHNRVAQALNEKKRSPVPKDWDLAFLPLDSREGRTYVREMDYCVQFALANRRLMMRRVRDIFEDVFPGCFEGVEGVGARLINIAHNYAGMERHFGRTVMVHRKGATLADRDTIGIIPGSQGSVSHIVRGLGNAESFNSCSHGAGRKMGRKQAERSLNLAEEIKRLDHRGVLHAIRGKRDLDEAAGAYKDIDTVMENQKDLVETLLTLEPLAVIKG